MVLDSPFSDLVDLMMELVDTYKFLFPKFTVSSVFAHMDNKCFLFMEFVMIRRLEGCTKLWN